MIRSFTRLLLAMAIVSSTIAVAQPVVIGTVSWDVQFPTTVGEFDIANQTGPNSTPSPDPTFPVSTPVSLTNLSLTYTLADTSTVTVPSTYFTLAGDGLSWDGASISDDPTDPIVSAVLTGMFASTTWILNDGSTFVALPSFSATISPSSPPALGDGDFGIIYANPAGTSPVPEPSTFSMMAGAVPGLLLAAKQLRKRR